MRRPCCRRSGMPVWVPGLVGLVLTPVLPLPPGLGVGLGTVGTTTRRLSCRCRRVPRSSRAGPPTRRRCCRRCVMTPWVAVPALPAVGRRIGFRRGTSVMSARRRLRQWAPVLGRTTVRVNCPRSTRRADRGSGRGPTGRRRPRWTTCRRWRTSCSAGTTTPVRATKARAAGAGAGAEPTARKLLPSGGRGLDRPVARSPDGVVSGVPHNESGRAKCRSSTVRR